MNKSRRKELSRVFDNLNDAAEALSVIREAEQEAFDALPENLQQTMAGEQIGSNAEELGGAEDHLLEALGYVEAVLSR